MQKEIITKDRLVEDIRKAGILEGDILNLKVSLKSIGWVEGGANTVIQAFLEVIGTSGTIVTDSFLSVKKYKELKRGSFLTDDNSPSYAGAIANAMLSYPGVRRSKHPIQKFAIIGKHADDFADNHTFDSYAYDVLRRMSEMGGKNIRLGDPNKVVGVGTTHVAIGMLKLQQKRLKYGVHYLDNNNTKREFLINWAGGCVAGFNKLLPTYKKIGAFLYEGKVGNATVIVSDMQKTLKWEIAEGERNPSFFCCDNPACLECRVAWKFSKGSVLKVMWENFKLKKYDYAVITVMIKLFGKYKPDLKQSKSVEN